jgi:hypothetical protein
MLHIKTPLFQVVDNATKISVKPSTHREIGTNLDGSAKQLYGAWFFFEKY